MKKNNMHYFDAAESWSTNIYSHATTWRNWAILIALLSLIITIISMLVLMSIMPLKETTPYLVFVDQDKGEPVTIRPVASNEMLENEHLKRYMIRKFIIARERYNINTLNDDSNIVYALSNEVVLRDYQYYLSKFDSTSSNIDVKAINISFLNAQRAYVSFTLIINEQGIVKEIPATAQIKFKFTDKLLPMDDAYQINPVNFEVETYQSHYQVNHEVYL